MTDSRLEDVRAAVETLLEAVEGITVYALAEHEQRRIAEHLLEARCQLGMAHADPDPATPSAGVDSAPHTTCASCGQPVWGHSPSAVTSCLRALGLEKSDGWKNPLSRLAQASDDSPSEDSTASGGTRETGPGGTGGISSEGSSPLPALSATPDVGEDCNWCLTKGGHTIGCPTLTSTWRDAYAAGVASVSARKEHHEEGSTAPQAGAETASVLPMGGRIGEGTSEARHTDADLAESYRDGWGSGVGLVCVNLGHPVYPNGEGDCACGFFGSTPEVPSVERELLAEAHRLLHLAAITRPSPFTKGELADIMKFHCGYLALPARDSQGPDA